MTNSTVPKDKVNKLPQGIKFKMCLWLQNKELKVSDTLVSLAAEAELMFNCKVTWHNIRGIFETIERSIPKADKPESERIDILVKEFAILAKSLGYAPTAAFQSISKE